MKMKPIKDQTIVITGASSGIGLATARKAAQQGAGVVLVARTGEALQDIKKEIEGGGRPGAGRRGRRRRRADPPPGRRGGAGARRGRHLGERRGREHLRRDQGDEARRRQAAVRHERLGRVPRLQGGRRRVPRARGRGAEYAGSLINIGSVLSDRAVPVQGRLLVEQARGEGADRRAADGARARGRAGVRHPDQAERDRHALRHAREEPAGEPRDAPAAGVRRGGSWPTRSCTRRRAACATCTPARAGMLLAKAGQWAPRLTDKIMEAGFFAPQQGDRPEEAPGDHGLYSPGGGRQRPRAGRLRRARRLRPAALGLQLRRRPPRGGHDRGHRARRGGDRPVRRVRRLRPRRPGRRRPLPGRLRAAIFPATARRTTSAAPRPPGCRVPARPTARRRRPATRSTPPTSARPRPRCPRRRWRWAATRSRRCEGRTRRSRRRRDVRRSKGTQVWERPAFDANGHSRRGQAQRRPGWRSESESFRIPSATRGGAALGPGVRHCSVLGSSAPVFVTDRMSLRARFDRF